MKSVCGNKRWAGAIALLRIFGALSALAMGSPCLAAEVYSNGNGGGLWSDPVTWRGNRVPAPTDDAVIARGDNVVFDRNDDAVALIDTSMAVIADAGRCDGTGALSCSASMIAGTSGKATCRKLFIDPKGLLSFKTGAGKETFCAAGPIESYGTIKLDGRKSSNDFLELRLVGLTLESRTLRLQKNGALLVQGYPGQASDRCNVALTALPQPNLNGSVVDADTLGTVEATAGTILDVQRAELMNIHLRAIGIDNTGAKANERCNIVESRFIGRSRLYCQSCDTPQIINNTFDWHRLDQLPVVAIHLYSSQLAEVRGNTIRGNYSTGINGTAQVDSVLAGNLIEKCGLGIYWYGTNGMLKQDTIRNCDTGLVLTSMTGTLEEVEMEGCKTGLNHAGATAQLTSCRVTKIPKDGMAVDYSSGPLTLLNCNIRPEQIKIEKQMPEPTPPAFLVQSMAFCVVGIKGGYPPDSLVEAITAKPPVPLPAGAADLNVRNSPAPIRANGLTPLPRALEPLILKSWMIDANSKLIPTPEYTLKVLGPPAGAAGERKLLNSVTVKPEDTWFRDKPNEAKATVEVSLK